MRRIDLEYAQLKTERNNKPADKLNLSELRVRQKELKESCLTFMCDILVEKNTVKRS